MFIEHISTMSRMFIKLLIYGSLVFSCNISSEAAQNDLFQQIKMLLYNLMNLIAWIPVERAPS